MWKPGDANAAPGLFEPLHRIGRGEVDRQRGGRGHRIGDHLRSVLQPAFRIVIAANSALGSVGAQQRRARRIAVTDIDEGAAEAGLGERALIQIDEVAEHTEHLPGEVG